MADNEFEINQVLKLTKEGGSAEDELKRLREQIKAATDDTAKYNEWIEKNTKAQVEAQAEELKHAKALEESKKETEKLSEAKKQAAKESLAASEMTNAGVEQNAKTVDGLKEGVKRLAMQFGELGHVALAALKSGPALVLVGIAVAISDLITRTSEWIAKIKAVADAIDALKTAKFLALQTAISGAAESLTRFNLEMKHAGEPSDPITAEFQARMAEFEARRQAAGKPITTAERQAIMEEEIARRKEVVPELEAKARAAQSAASAPNDTLIDLEATLAGAVSKRPELQKAVQDAKTPDWKTVALYMTQLGGPELLQKKIASDVWNAEADLAINMDDIKHYGGLASQERSKQLILQDTAQTAQGRFTANQNRITELSAGVTNSQATRRGETAGARDALVNQFTAEGLPASFAGAGTAAAALAAGHRAAPADAGDYNALMAALHLTKKQQGEITKLLIEIFKDGIVKPEELQKLKQVVNANNQR